MPIARLVPPEVIASGIVTSVQERNFENKRTGWRIGVSQETGAQLSINMSEAGAGNFAGTHDVVEAQLPKLGQFIAYNAQVSESRDFGASLRYAGEAHGALDSIHSRLNAK